MGLAMEWKGWAVIDEKRGILYVRQEHGNQTLGEYWARQEARQYVEQGYKVRVARVRITEDTAK